MCEHVTKPAFSVIGREGSTQDGEGFIARLWETANAHFAEIAALTKPGSGGSPVGIWGAMSDFSRSFKPWEESFSKGLYLAGVEARDGALPPEGWTVWTLPAMEYLRVPVGPGGTGVAFEAGIRELREQGIELAAAAQEFTDPARGEAWVLFPIRKL